MRDSLSLPQNPEGDTAVPVGMKPLPPMSKEDFWNKTLIFD